MAEGKINELMYEPQTKNNDVISKDNTGIENKPIPITKELNFKDEMVAFI
jgi:hypothetical protein